MSLAASPSRVTQVAVLTVLLKWFFGNLRVKIILLILLIQASVTIGIVSLVVNHQRSEALAQLKQELGFRAKAINLGIITETDLYNGPKLQHLVKEVGELDNVLRLRLVNRDHVVIASTEAAEIDRSTDPSDAETVSALKELEQVLKARQALMVEETTAAGHVLRMIAPMFIQERPVAVAEIHFSLKNLDAKLAGIWLQGLWIAFFLVALSSLGLIYALNHMVIVPLRKLTGITQEIAVGTYTPSNLELKGPTDEVGRLYRAIDTMAADLQEQQRLLVAQERYRQELEVGTSIQLSMLPQAPPEIPGLDIAFHFQPADEVGGDYYDLVPLGDRYLAIAVGDVNGHGLGAALLMAMAKSAFHTQVRRDPEVGSVMSGLNEMVYGATQERRFMTFFYGLLDLETRELVYGNAGHHYPYHLSHAEGRLESLKPSVYPLGVRVHCEYSLRRCRVASGDVLVLYSDGIIEAQGSDGEEYGFERFEAHIWEHQQKPAAEIRDALLASLNAHQQGLPQGDDVTLVVLKFA